MSEGFAASLYLCCLFGVKWRALRVLHVSLQSASFLNNLRANLFLAITYSGYSHDDNTWEPVENIYDSSVIKAYESRARIQINVNRGSFSKGDSSDSDSSDSDSGRESASSSTETNRKQDKEVQKTSELLGPAVRCVQFRSRMLSQ